MNKPKSVTKNEEVVIPVRAVLVFTVFRVATPCKGVVVFAYGSAERPF